MKLWEAIKALEEGHKVKRKHWLDGCYLQLDDLKDIVNQNREDYKSLCYELAIPTYGDDWEICKGNSDNKSSANSAEWDTLVIRINRLEDSYRELLKYINEKVFK
jgi:hypothetical protein